ncbi:hypothetical protein HRI96_08770 [Treponema parvum]|uniref:TP-1001-like C-terminal domain-containing protein n=1 Tax=Treponema parvum TaxID=138851 RepID=A0A975ICY4_9SPIR|nr:hypothetical protein [Treponema parvum]QTQ12282.1 hypothetical protein HRI96_08770 [Treponema parvum]
MQKTAKAVDFKSFLKRSFSIFFQTLFWSSAVLSSVYNISCRISAEGIQILSGDYESPKILSIVAESEKKITVSLSEEVNVIGLTLSRQSAVLSDASVPMSGGESGKDVFPASLYAACGVENSIPISIESEEGGRLIICNLAMPTEIGRKYVLYGEIEDKNGNTLTFSSPVIGFNPRAARVVFSEIQDRSTEKGGVEFIELYVLEPGNLSGLVISSANDGKDYDVCLPPVEVDAGDFVVVHLRNSGDGCISEYGDDLELSTAQGSSSSRDIWIVNTDSRLGSTQDVLLLEDSNRSLLIDAFLYTKNSKTQWMKAPLEEAARRAYESGVWKSGFSIDNAFKVAGDSMQCIFARKNLSALDSAAESGTLPAGGISVVPEDWERKTASSVTPGR